MPSKTFNLMLVRHGQTYENKLKIIQGQADTQLTETGREQARQLGEYFKANASSLKFDKVYSSDLSRAHDTCRIVTGDRQDVILNQKIRERSFGVIQGQSMKILKEEAFKAGFDETNYTQFRPEGGETLDDLHTRVVEFCSEELYQNAADGSSILVFTHGGVIREFLKYFKREGCDIDTKDLFITPSTAMNSFEIKVSEEGKLESVHKVLIHHIPHLAREAKAEATHEEQLNEASHGRKEEYAL